MLKIKNEELLVDVMTEVGGVSVAGGIKEVRAYIQAYHPALLTAFNKHYKEASEDAPILIGLNIPNSKNNDGLETLIHFQ